jgi:hypothetical protein
VSYKFRIQSLTWLKPHQTALSAQLQAISLTAEMKNAKINALYGILAM